jgi:hypothetical protein
LPPGNWCEARKVICACAVADSISAAAAVASNVVILIDFLLVLFVSGSPAVLRLVRWP